MSWNCHNSTRSIACQHIITNPNRNFRTCKRIFYVSACKLSGNCFHIRHTIAFRTLFCLINILLNSYFKFIGGNSRNIFMLGRQCHIRHTKNRIRTRGKHLYFKFLIRSKYFAFYLKTNGSAFRSTNPISLLFFNCVRPIEAFQAIN